MDQIYTKAERTVVWPGDRFDSGMASRMLLRLYCTNYTFNAKDEEFLLFFEYEIVRRGWQAMIALFENPYFTRIWCVQEVALGRRVEVVHGNKDIPWEIFVETLKSYTHPRRASLLAWSTKDAMDRAISPNAPGGPSGIMVMEHIRQQQHAGATAKALHIGLLMVSCAEFEATEVKDRIFGVNGLIFGSHKVTPNYDLTNSQVFAAASILALRQPTYPFAALVYAGIGWGPLEASLPSWVVNWGRSYNHATTWSPQLRDLDTTGQSSATHLPSEIAIDGNNGLLCIKGFRVDAIWSQTSAATRTSATGELTTRFQRLVMRSRWYLDAANLSRARFKDYPFPAKLREEAFWRTVIADLSMMGRPAPQYFEEMHVWYQKWCQARLSTPLDDSIAWTKHILSTPEVYSLWPSTLEQRGRVSDFVSLVASAINGRRFAVTESGLMCLTPTESKEGDLVVIFHGAPTPFLLRTLQKDGIGSGSVDDTYQLVGECYVHGFMDRFDSISGFSPPSTETFTIV